MKDILQETNTLCDKLTSIVQDALTRINSSDARETAEQLQSINEAISDLQTKKVTVPQQLADLKAALEQADTETQQALDLVDSFNQRMTEWKSMFHVEKPDTRAAHPPKVTPSRNRITEEELEPHIVEVLKKMGGCGTIDDVLAEVGVRIEDRFTDQDLELDSNGRPHWHITASWAHQNLMDSGVIEIGSPGGTWQLTPQVLKKSA